MAPKKNKKSTQSLASFLGQEKTDNWADDIDESMFQEERKEEKVTGAQASGWRGGGAQPEVPQSRRPFAPHAQKELPSRPPFTLYVGNLAFDVGEADVQDFFGPDCTSVRMMLDRETQQSKGFCYAEFSSRNALAEALQKDGQMFGPRAVRLDVAESRGQDRKGGGGRDGPPGPPPEWDRNVMGSGVVEGRAPAQGREPREAREPVNFDRNAMGTGTQGGRGFGAGGGGGFSRDAMGAEQQAGRGGFAGRESRPAPTFDRESMGAEQQPTQRPAGREPASFDRDTMGTVQASRGPRGPAAQPEFDRDAMGTSKASEARSQPPPQRTEPSDWRSAAPAEQPVAAAGGTQPGRGGGKGRGGFGAVMFDREAMGSEQQRVSTPPVASTADDSTQDATGRGRGGGKGGRGYAARGPAPAFDRSSMGSAAPSTAPAANDAPSTTAKQADDSASWRGRNATAAPDTAQRPAHTNASASGWRSAETAAKPAKSTAKPKPAPETKKKAATANGNIFAALGRTDAPANPEKAKKSKKGKKQAATEEAPAENEDSDSGNDWDVEI